MLRNTVIMKTFHVYILTNKYNKLLYVGVTSCLKQRVSEHKQGFGGSFTSRYKINKLVYAEPHNNAVSAIRREKQIKGWARARKISLINKANPKWEELDP